MKSDPNETTRRLEEIKKELEEGTFFNDSKHPYEPYKLSELVSGEEICECYGLSKRTMRLMRDSISLPTIVWVGKEETKLTKRLGLTVGKPYYLPREFEDLKRKKKLTEFQE